jgi:tRNA(Ile)-lysidine synthase TilS/MesJ
MIRGSGIKGLGSLQEKFKFNKYKTIICRPLLKYTKKSLISFLANEDQKYILDPTNYNDSFDRSRVRKVTQHLINEGLDDLRLKKTIKNLKDANNSINYLLNTSIKKFLSVNDYGLFSISLRNLNHYQKKSNIDQYLKF